MDDLQTPAQTIATCCEALLSEVDGNLTAEQRQFVETMLSNVARFTNQTTVLADRIAQMWAGQAYFEIGHELRSPLTTIFGYNHVLLNGMAGTFNDEQRTHLQTIEVMSNQLRESVDQLFNKAKRDIID